MSLRVILTQYLAAMKERDELDVLLPELLIAMGHDVLSRPERGTRQGGIDCLSQIQTEEGIEAYLFIIKQGDVDRTEFFAVPQGIAASIEEARIDYVRTRLPSHLIGKPKRFVLVATGRMREQVLQNWASLTKRVAEDQGSSLDFWGGEDLAKLVEDHLLDENVVLGDGRAQLRQAIATISATETATGHVVRYFAGVMNVESKPNWKRVAKQMTGALLGWLVFASWCQLEGNLKPAMRSGEHLLLLLWSFARRADLHENRAFREKYEQAVRFYAQFAVAYFEKILPQLLHARSLISYRPMYAPYANLVMEEIGRLACFILMLRDSGEATRHEATRTLAKLFEVHEGCILPHFDGHSIDLSVALATFIRQGADQPVTALTHSCIARLRRAATLQRYVPIDSDAMDDSLAIELGHVSRPADMFEVSTLIPMIATVVALQDDCEALRHLSQIATTRLKATTLERWFPNAALETAWGLSHTGSFGVSRSIMIETDPAVERQAAAEIPQGASPPADFPSLVSYPWLLALSARTFRHPLPPWYFACLPRPGASYPA